MDPFKRVEIGSTGLFVTRCGLGARGIVDPYLEVTDAQARETVETTFDVGINYIDTSPRYGLGRSEKFVGQVVPHKDRDSFILSTKVGRILDPEANGGWYWDFSGAAVRKCLKGSLERLNLDRTDILFIHSPRNHFEVAMSDAYPALDEMRSSGVIKAFGVGMTDVDKLLRFAQEGDFDCFLLAGRYTLLDQSALPEFLPYCQNHNIGIILGGAFNSGILASDLGPDAKYDYRVASPEILARARRIRDVCARYNVPLKAVALQFVLAHPAVTTVIPGSSYPEHVHENIAMIQYDIPSDLWDDLRSEGLIADGAPAPSQ